MAGDWTGRIPRVSVSRTERSNMEVTRERVRRRREEEMKSIDGGVCLQRFYKDRRTGCVEAVCKSLLSVDQDARSEPLSRKHTNLLLIKWQIRFNNIKQWLKQNIHVHVLYRFLPLAKE